MSTEKEKELAKVREAKLKADGEAGLLIECGCCFSEVSFDDVGASPFTSYDDD